MSAIWEEVKRRKIFKAATIYAAIAWGVIQIADVLLPVLGISNWVMSSMVLIAFSGFPVALIFGWMLDLKIERQQQSNIDSDGETFVKQSKLSRIFELAVISCFGLGAMLLYYNSVSEPVIAKTNTPPNIQQLVNPQSVQKTIAVLPFANFSDLAQDEYFADGLTEELLNVLARNKKLRVAARTSSFQYKNTNINVKTIAAELGVQFILEGSVRRSGDLIRVTIQLIKADEDIHVFSKSWDRNLTSVFQVQDEIALSVMQELQVSLLGGKQNKPSDIGTQNITAFADYSRGLALLRNRTKTDFDGAIVHFQNALKQDGNYAEAMTMLAETYLLQSSYDLLKKEAAISLAQPLLIKALSINPELGSVHAVNGLMNWQLANGEKDKDLIREYLELAKKDLTIAIDINPSLAEAYMWYGSILQNQGLFLEGAQLRQKAYQIDPQAAVVGFNRAQDLVQLGDYKQAMEVFNSVVRNNPNYPNAYSIAGDVSYAVGQIDQAYSMYYRMFELGEDQVSWLVHAAKLLVTMSEFESAQRNIDQLKTSSQSENSEKFDGLQATVWIASGDYDAFYQWTNTFTEQTQEWGQRLWRGFASLSQQNWKFAVVDLQQALSLSKQDNPNRIDEHTIRIQLFLAKAYIELGDSLRSEQYLNEINKEISWLSQQGVTSQALHYQQAAHAALSGNNEAALSLLRQSVLEGFVDWWWAENDPVFSQIKQSNAFFAIKNEFKIRIRLMQNNIEAQFGKLNVGP